MNIDLLKFSTHDKTNYYIETLFTKGYLHLLITKPTRVTSHSATLIDHIYTNKIDCDITAGHSDYGCSRSFWGNVCN